MMGVKKINVVVVGDESTGKSSLIKMFLNGTFPEESAPRNASENYVVDTETRGKQVELTLWDITGTEDSGKLKTGSYRKAHVALVCFSTENPASYYNILEKWIPNIKEMCHGAAIIIVANKKDLRDDQQAIDNLRKLGEEPISLEQGLNLAHLLGAFHYLECSALQNDGVTEVFMIAAKAGLKVEKKRKENNCEVM